MTYVRSLNSRSQKTTLTGVCFLLREGGGWALTSNLPWIPQLTSGSEGGAWGPALLTPRFGGLTVQFGGPSAQFRNKIMNFRALIIFFQKILSLALLSINIIFLSHSSSLSLLIISSHLHISTFY